MALYRYERDGWTIQDVAAELRRQTYRDGHIAGYIYAMARTKPSLALHHPVTIEDRNDVRPRTAAGPPPEVPAGNGRGKEVADAP